MHVNTYFDSDYTMPLSEDTKRKLVEALLRLNGISKNKAALALDLKRQNLYGWLKGVDSAIANSKKIDLLKILGVKEGQLDSGKIHRWCIQRLEDVPFVISTLTEAETAPQELFVMGIWPANDSDAVLRLTTNARHHTYLLLYYPATETPPQKITADSLGIGTQMQSIVPLNKEQWSSWLEPQEVDAELIKKTVDFEIQYNLPHDPLDEEPDDLTGDESHYDELATLVPPTASKDQLKQWEDLLDRALMSGRSFEQIVAETKAAMNLYSFRELRAMQKGKSS